MTRRIQLLLVILTAGEPGQRYVVAMGEVDTHAQGHLV